MEGQRIAILDSSVLINYLVVERAGLLTSNPAYRFVLTDHVRGEVTHRYPQQFKLLSDLLAMRAFEEIRVDDLEEVKTFASLSACGLGQGECAAIAVAANRYLAVAIDDVRARKRAKSLFPAIKLLDTIEIMVVAIQAEIITVREADQIKDEWAEKYKFRRNFESFSELLY